MLGLEVFGDSKEKGTQYFDQDGTHSWDINGMDSINVKFLREILDTDRRVTEVWIVLPL